MKAIHKGREFEKLAIDRCTTPNKSHFERVQKQIAVIRLPDKKVISRGNNISEIILLRALQKLYLFANFGDSGRGGRN